MQEEPQFWNIYAVPFGMTILGSFLGAWIGVWISNRDARRKFEKERADILKALLNSLKTNHDYLEQVTNLHFENSQVPTFELDTVALAHISLNARKYLPEGTNWSERYNKLRFELDHINRKILMFYIRAVNYMDFPQEFDNSSGSPTLYAHQQSFNGLRELIDRTKESLKSEIETLEPIA